MKGLVLKLTLLGALGLASCKPDLSIACDISHIYASDCITCYVSNQADYPLEVKSYKCCVGFDYSDSEIAESIESNDGRCRLLVEGNN